MATNIRTGVKSFFETRVKPSTSKYGNVALGYAGRLGNQKYMTAIRDAFAILIPLIIAGGFAILMRFFVFGAGDTTQISILGWIGFATGDTIIKPAATNPDAYGFIDNSVLAKISTVGNFGFYAVSEAIFGYVSLYISFTLGFLVGAMRNSTTPVLNGFVGMMAFMGSTIMKTSLWGAYGLLTAIVVSILASEALSLLSKSKRLLITMPDGVPPAVSRAFARLFPAIIVLFMIFFVNLPFQLFSYLSETLSPLGGAYTQFGLADAIYVGVQAPFVQFAADNNGGLGVAIIYVVAVMLLWFFGLHGTNILNGIFSPLYTALQLRNLNEGGNVVFAGATFDAFIWFGGAGVTLALVLALLIFARKGTAERSIAALSVGPAVFNINEPMIFGLPLVLNVKWVVPFVLVPVTLVITTYLGFTIGNINPVKISMPWVTPIGISAFFVTTDWKAIILAVINFGIAFALYLPFVFIWTRKQTKNAPVELAQTSVESSVVEKVVAEAVAPAKRGRPAKVGSK